MSLDSHSEDDLEDLAGVYKGLSHEARLAILFGLNDDANLNEVADFLDITRGALQDHIQMLLDAELIYRPEESGTTYSLTPLGEYFVEKLEQDEETVIQALKELEEAEQELQEKYQGQIEGVEDSDLIDQGKIEKKVHTEKWEQVAGKVWDLLTRSN
ncbi:ArsR/SmtB family transcription factor [Haloarcula japonica]|uniref:ArsR/SmtB family transcription factor n=1 Tax=Haloarcula japonica TaxID=29282 RepID=UPI0039F6B585